MSATFISWVTPDYLPHQAGIRADCEKYGYDFYGKTIDLNIERIAQGWAYKPYFIRDCLEKFDQVVFVDAEVRIHKPLPKEWLEAELLLPKFSPRMVDNLLIRYHSGFMVLNKKMLPMIDTWIRIQERWDLSLATNLEINRWDYVLTDASQMLGTFFIGDETALFASLASLGVFPKEISVAWKNPILRNGEEMCIGDISNEKTFLTHSFLHHWGQEKFSWKSYEYFRVFRYHYKGAIELIDKRMQEGQGSLEELDWFFDFERREYSPSHQRGKKMAKWDAERQKFWDKTWS